MRQANPHSGKRLVPGAFFYTIPFDGPGQKLTREMLAKHYPPPTGRWGHSGIDSEYLDFKHGILSVYVKLADKSEHTIFLHVEAMELHVACSCGMPDKKLCIHAYMGLYCLAWYDQLELKQCYWPGITTNDKVKNKFLKTEISKKRLSVKPYAKYGNLFRPDIGFHEEHNIVLAKPSNSTAIVSGGQNVVAYCFAHNYGNYSNSHLPVVVPCLGVSNKSNSAVTSFKAFDRKDKPLANIAYTANQRQLNEICFEQYETAKAYSLLFEKERTLAGTSLKEKQLALWEQAIPLLLNEGYHYAYYTYWLKYLKSKPRKTDMRSCRYSLERPVLSFVLKFHQDHYSLTPLLSVNGIALEFKHKPSLLVLDNKTDRYYAMASVQDDDLLMWMLSHDNQLTILKEHFADFHQSFLAKLSSLYLIQFLDHRTKKSIPYNLKMVLDNKANH